MNHRPHSRHALALLTLPLAAIVLTIAAASCDDGSHAYSAQQFDRQRRCLGAAVSLDVVTGNNPGAGCAVKCLVPRSSSTGSAEPPLYVSTQCPPYPSMFDTSGTQPGCDEAIAAMERGDNCLADGGSSHPGPGDGGGSVQPDSGGNPRDAESDSANDATLQDASLDADASDT